MKKSRVGSGLRTQDLDFFRDSRRAGLAVAVVSSTRNEWIGADPWGCANVAASKSQNFNLVPEAPEDELLTR